MAWQLLRAPRDVGAAAPHCPPEVIHHADGTRQLSNAQEGHVAETAREKAIKKLLSGDHVVAVVWALLAIADAMEKAKAK